MANFINEVLKPICFSEYRLELSEYVVYVLFVWRTEVFFSKYAFAWKAALRESVCFQVEVDDCRSIKIICGMCHSLIW